VLLKSKLKGWHECVEQWRVYPEKDSYLKVEDVGPYLKVPTLLQHSDVSWKYMEHPHAKMGRRYIKCDYTFPGIVALDVTNPHNRKYRMIDGSHRMAKMVRETDITESYFYIITSEQFFSLLRDKKI